MLPQLQEFMEVTPQQRELLRLKASKLLWGFFFFAALCPLPARRAGQVRLQEPSRKRFSWEAATDPSWKDTAPKMQPVTPHPEL